MPVIAEGDRLLIIERRLFKDDNARLFVGVVEACEAHLVRVRGYPFHLNPYEVSGIDRHGEERTRVLSIEAGELIYVLPRELDVARLQLRRSPKSLILTDGDVLTLDLSEWLIRA